MWRRKYGCDRSPWRAGKTGKDPDTASGEGGERRAGDPEFRKWAEAEDQTGIEDQVKDIRHPEQAHGDGSIAGAAEDGVVQKKQHNHTRAAKSDAGVIHAGGNDRWGSAHQSQQTRGQQEKRKTKHQRGDEPEEHRLDRGNGCAVRIPFSNSSRDHRGGRHGKPHGDGKDQGQNRLGEADGGNRVRTKAADPEDVNDSEERFEHHLQHHGDGEQQD